MNYDNNRQNAHNEIDHIFKDLLPTRNMAERPKQVALCHRMLDAMLDGGIALCDAGTGIGKTYAYLVAGTAFSRFRAASGLEPKPILVSTSSIALQNAVLGEYLPLLSSLLLEDGMIEQPLQAVIRKGKSHYVCDVRLERRLGQLDLQKKNWKAGSPPSFRSPPPANARPKRLWTRSGCRTIARRRPAPAKRLWRLYWPRTARRRPKCRLRTIWRSG